MDEEYENKHIRRIWTAALFISGWFADFLFEKAFDILQIHYRPLRSWIEEKVEDLGDELYAYVFKRFAMNGLGLMANEFMCSVLSCSILLYKEAAPIRHGR